MSSLYNSYLFNKFLEIYFMWKLKFNHTGISREIKKYPIPRLLTRPPPLLCCIMDMVYSKGTRTMNAMALFSLYLYFIFALFVLFFYLFCSNFLHFSRTSQSQLQVEETAETFFQHYFQTSACFYTFTAVH